MKKSPLVMIVMDGLGYSPVSDANAVEMSGMPFYRGLVEKYPNTLLSASGRDVGLPGSEHPGNCDVGHLVLGAGRNWSQDFLKINDSLENGSFFKNDVLVEACKIQEERGGRLHLIGEVSNNNRNSSMEHLFSMVRLAKYIGVEKVVVHAIIDEDDSKSRSGISNVRQVADFLKQNTGKIGSVCGRYYVKDGPGKWGRLKEYYDVIVSGKFTCTSDFGRFIKEQYDRGATDEFVRPVLLDFGSSIRTGDSVVFFNFKPDFLDGLVHALTNRDFRGFERDTIPSLDYCATLTDYGTMELAEVVFPVEDPGETLADVFARNDVNQLYMCDVTKEDFVKKSFCGKKAADSDKVHFVVLPFPPTGQSEALDPFFSIDECTDMFLKAIRSRDYGFLFLNLSSADLAGHTGILDTAIKACNSLDWSLSVIAPEVIGLGGTLILTSDHGNVEQMMDEEFDLLHAEHTRNKVPFVMAGRGFEKEKLKDGGGLRDVAPTLLKIAGFDKPDSMNGDILLL